MPSERRGRSPSISPRRERGPIRSPSRSPYRSSPSVSPSRRPIPESLKKDSRANAGVKDGASIRSKTPSEAPSETKSCTSCGETQGVEKFKTNGTKPDGTKYRMATCRNCTDRQKAERLISDAGGNASVSGPSKNDILLELARGLSKVSGDMTMMSANINCSS